MAIKYPASIDTTTTLPEFLDGQPITAARINSLREVVIAIETELGVRPSLLSTTVRARLDTMDGTLSGLQIIKLATDLSGTINNPQVVGIRGNPISTNAPTIGDVLSWSGTSWTPVPGSLAFLVLSGDLSGNLLHQNVIGIQSKPLQSSLSTIGATQDGYILTWINGDGYWEAKPPAISFTAGGDLSGTNVSQTLSKLQGKTLGTSLASVGASQDGYTLTWVNGSAEWQAKPDLLDIFNPASLPLTGWWRDYPNFVFTENWISQPSAGNSGGKTLYHGASSPGNGSLLNGYTTALFDGTYTSTNALEGSAPFTLADTLSTTKWWIAFLFKPSMINAPGDNPTLDPAPWASRALAEDSGYGYWGIHLDTAGLHAFANDGAHRDVVLPCSNNVWHYAIAWFDGTHINLELDGVVATPTACGTMTGLLGVFRLGDSYSTAHYGGLISECMTSNTLISATDRQNIREYFNSRYALDLSYVTNIQGKTLGSSLTSIGSAQDGYGLTWVNGSSEWQAKPAAIGFTAGGDLSGTATNQQVISLTGSGGIVTGPATALKLGATPYATTGTLRVSKNFSLVARNSTDTGDLNIILLDGANNLSLNTSSVITLASNSITLQAVGNLLNYTNGDIYIDGASVNFRGASHGSSVALNFASETNPKLTIGSTMLSWTMNQADISTASATGATTIIQAQNATGTTSIGGNLVLQSGTGTNHAGSLILNYGAASVFTASSTGINITTPTNTGLSLNASNANMLVNVTGANGIYIAATTQVFRDTAAADWLTFTGLSAGASTATIATGVTSFTLSQALHATVAHPMTIQAGNVTTGIGSDLTLQSGTGSVHDGYVFIKTGNTTAATFAPTGITLGLPFTSISVGTAPFAVTGDIRVGKSFSLMARKADNAADITLLSLDGSNNVQVLTPASYSISSAAVNLQATGNVTIYTAGSEYIDAAAINLRGVGHTAKIKIDFASEVTPFLEWAGSGETPATTGTFRVPNGFSLIGKNASLTDMPLISNTGGNNITIGSQTTPTGVIDIQCGAGGGLRTFSATHQAFPAASGQTIWLETFALAYTKVWDAAVTSISLSQADRTTASGVGSNLTIQAQNATGATSTGGNLILNAGTGTTSNGYITTTSNWKMGDTGGSPSATVGSASGTQLLFRDDSEIRFRSGAITYGGMYMTAGNIYFGSYSSAASFPVNTYFDCQTATYFRVLGGTYLKIDTTIGIIPAVANLQWITSPAGGAPVISQADLTTNSGTAQALTIHAQNETGTTSIGGDLVLTSGTGTSTPGTTSVQVGGVTKLSLGPTVSALTGTNSINLQANSAIKLNLDGVGGTAAFSSLSQFLWSSTTGVSTNALHFNLNDTGTTSIEFSTSVTAATITQALHATVAHPMTIQAGNVTTGTGSNLILQSGSGSVEQGKISFMLGAYEKARIDPTFGNGVFGGNSGATAYSTQLGPVPGFETTIAGLWFIPQTTTRSLNNSTIYTDASSTSLQGVNTVYLGAGFTNYVRMNSATWQMGNSYATPQYIFDYSTTAIQHFGNSATSAKITYDAPASDILPQMLVLNGQQPYSLATGINKSPADVCIDIPQDSNGGGSNKYGGLLVSYNNTVTPVVRMGLYSAANYGAIWFKDGGTPGSTNWAFLGSAADTYFNAPSSQMYFGIGATYHMSMTASVFNMGAAYSSPDYVFDFSHTAIQHFTVNATSATIKYDNIVANSGAGNVLTIQGQNNTGTTSTGGALVLTSGTGTSTGGAVTVNAASGAPGVNGTVHIQSGGSDVMTAGPVSSVLSAVFSAAESHQIRSVTANYTFDASGPDYTIFANLSGTGGGNITFPNAASFPGRIIVIKDTGACGTTGSIQLTRVSTNKIDNVDGNVTVSTDYGWWVYQSDGTNWWRIG